MEKKKMTLSELYAKITTDLKKSDKIPERMRVIKMLQASLNFVETIENHPRREKLIYYACFFDMVTYMVEHKVLSIDKVGFDQKARKGITGVLLRLMDTCDRNLKN